jgi:septum formation protein
MTSDPFIILASGSPRRREFMQLLGLPFRVITPAMVGEAVDETPRPNEKPQALVQRLSRLKAEAVLKHLPSLTPPAFDPLPSYTLTHPVVIAADTVVVFHDQILGKPQNPAEARHMLKQLRRETHSVYTGFSLAWFALSTPQNPSHITRLHHSRVAMRPYTDAEIEAYIASGDPLDKAGAYGIQNKEFNPVAELDGCYAGVMGLPLGMLAEALREIELDLPPIAPLCHHFTGHACCQQ